MKPLVANIVANVRHNLHHVARMSLRAYRQNMNTNDGLQNGAATDHDQRGRFRPGNNARFSRQLKVQAKAEELRRAYFPNGGDDVLDGNRLRLAAKHLIIAEVCTDPEVCVRSTRAAELLLSKLSKVEPERRALAAYLDGETA